MSAQITLSHYLLRRLKELNVGHIFGIPGDYVLPFFDQVLDADHDVEHIMPCNELNGAYAADGYAKLAGFGAMAVTFGVGSLSTVNAVAGAYADDTPIIVICGCPSLDVVSKPTQRLYHHTVGTDFDTNLKVFDYITCAALRLTDISTAPREVDATLRCAVQQKKPVYLEIPYDLQLAEVSAPARPIDLMMKQSSTKNLEDSISAARALLQKSGSRAVIAGHLLQREGMIDAGRSLVDALNAAVATTFTCKMGAFEAHDNCVGIYMGEVCEDYTKEAVHQAGLAICAGMTFNEFDTGVFSTRIGEDQDVMWIQQNYVEVNGQRFDEVYLRDFLPALVECARDAPEGPFELSERRRFAFERADRFEPTDNAITIDRLFIQFANYLEPEDMLFGDTGGFINSSQAEFPDGVIMHGCGNWGSLGAGFGMFVGACFAPSAADTRCITIQGEGAFTMSAQDLSTLIRHRKDLALFILDNGGYGAERAIHPGKERAYNDINPWRYELLAQALGGVEGEDVHSYVVNTEREVAEVFDALAAFTGVHVVRIMLDRWDSATFNLRFSELLRH